MATKIQSTEVIQQKKVFVKSEQALKEMQSNGQLQPHTDYYTPEEGQQIQLFRNYPVGSIYISTYSTDPALPVEQGGLGGGIWEQLKDRFLLGAGDTYSNGDTGGSADAVVVSHTHGFNSGGAALTMYSSGAETSSGFDSGSYWGGVNKQISGIAANGVSGTGKNMPPYLVVYMWKRIG